MRPHLSRAEFHGLNTNKALKYEPAELKTKWKKCEGLWCFYFAARFVKAGFDMS